MTLLERDEVLGSLQERVDEARHGSGSFVTLGGEAGIGKSATVEALRDRLTRARFLLGRCDSLSTPRALSPVIDIARDRSSGLADVMRGPGHRQEVFAAVLDELGSTLRPSVVVIEDAHWADEATLDLLRFVGRRVAATHGVVVVTYRDDEVGPRHPLRAVFGDLATARRVWHLTLDALSVEAVAAIVGDRGLDPEEIHRITGGNPFFVTELVAAGGDTVPRTVADAVLARAMRLAPGARRLVDTVSINPDHASDWLIDRLCSATDVEKRDAVDGGLLVQLEDGMRFRHDLARRAVESALDDVTARDLHHRVLEALEDPPDGEHDAALITHHAAAVGYEERLIAWAPKAAEEAIARSSFAEAVAHDQRLLEAPSLEARERRVSLERLAASAREINRHGLAVDALEEALELVRGEGDRVAEAEVLARLAHARWITGRGPEAMGLVADAVRLVEGEPSSSAVGWVYATTAALSMLHRDIEAAVIHGDLAVRIGEETGDRALVCRALNALGAAKIVGGLDGGTADLVRSADIAEALGSPVARASAFSNLGSGLGEMRRYGEAVDFLEKTIEYGGDHDLDFSVDYARAWLARVSFERADWGLARLHARKAMRGGRAPEITRIVAETVLGRVAIRSGEASAAALADAHRLALETGDLQRTWPVVAGLAEAAWLRGSDQRIAGIIGDVYTEAVDRGIPWAKGELALWMWRGGDITEAPTGCPEPIVLQIEGDVRGAAAAWQELGCRYEAADAMGDGDDEAALEALAVFDDLGAVPAARRLRRVLRQRGLSVPRGPRAETRQNPAGLTPRQMEVLGLLTEGMSNADIAAELYVAEKTVAHHVSAILQRLDVTSRGEAAALARRTGLIPADEGG